MNNQVVLDASALLALIHREAGESIVAEYIQRGAAAVSTVNVSEVVSKQIEIGIPPAEALSMIELLGIQIIDFDAKAALHAAELRRSTKTYGLSLGDRACLALGILLGCPVLTADKAWSQLDIGVEILVIR